MEQNSGVVIICELEYLPCSTAYYAPKGFFFLGATTLLVLERGNTGEIYAVPYITK